MTVLSWFHKSSFYTRSTNWFYRRGCGVYASWQHPLVSASALGLVLLLFDTGPWRGSWRKRTKCRCCFTSCLALGKATGLPGAENQETHKPEQNPGHLSIPALRSASLRFTPTTTTYGHRVPTELCPTGPVVFCGGASHSLPLFVCNMITHRRGCFASCLTTKTHHR